MKVYKKIFATLLALLMPVQAAGGLNLNSTKIENRSFNTEKLRRKNLAKNVFVGGCLTCIGTSATVIGSLTISEVYKSRMNDVYKLVENLEEKDIANKILEEVKKLQKRSNGIFKVKESFCKVDPHVSLRFLLQVNAILDLLPGFEKLLIRNHSHFISSYKFTFSTEEFEGDSNRTTMACFKYPLGKIKYNTKIKISKTYFNSLDSAENSIRSSIFSGHNARVQNSKELESIIVHELGHALQHALFLKEDSWRKLDDIAKYHKEEILNIAWDKYHTTNSCVSTYGETNEKEWFAELFAHTLLSDTSTNLGRAMCDFLKNQGMYN